MKEHIYRTDSRKIFGQSWLIGFFLISYIVFISYVFISLTSAIHSLILILIILIVLPGIFVGLGLYIFHNYWRFSISKELVVTYDSIKLVDKKTNRIIQIKNVDIESIELFQNLSNSKFPWTFFEYFVLRDKNQTKIIVTSFTMDIKDFWQDTLTRKISSDKLTVNQKLFPLIKR